MSDEIAGNSVGSDAATSVEPGAAHDGNAAVVGDAAPSEALAGWTAEGSAAVEDDGPVEDGPVEDDVPGSAEPAAPTQVKPAATKVERSADDSGPKAERKGDGPKSPKKPKKKSAKAKSRGEEIAGSAKKLPKAPTSEEPSAHSDGEKPVDGQRGRVRRILVDNFLAVILSVVAIGLAVALALTALQLGNKNTLLSAQVSVLAVAKTYSVELAGYDYRHLDQDFGVVLSHSTPSFRSSFGKSSNALKSTLLKYHATAKATVVAAGLVSATTGRAVALVFLDQTVTNSTQKRPTTDRSQVEITLVRAGGTWLIDQVTLL